MPHQVGRGPQRLDRQDGVVLAVGPREHDHADPGRHQAADPVGSDDRCTVTDDSSMTGLARSRSATTVAWSRAVALVGGGDVEPEGLARPDPADPAQPEGGQRPLDGGALRVGDPLAQPDLHQHRELSRRAMVRHRTSRPAAGRRPARRTRCRGPRWPRRSRRAASGAAAACPRAGPPASRAAAACRRTGGLVPGAQSSAGQNRDESGVRTSSQMDSTPSMYPSSNLVSQMTMPWDSARAAARRVGGQAQRGGGLGGLPAHDVDGLGHPDVEVVTLGGLGRGGEDGLGQTVGMAQPGGHGHAVHGARPAGTP